MSKKLKHPDKNFTLSAGYLVVKVDDKGEAIVDDDAALEIMAGDFGFTSMSDVEKINKTVKAPEVIDDGI